MKTERVIVTRPMIGLLYMQVCAVADATDEEILTVANCDNLCGTSQGWVKVVRRGDGAPVQCQDYPDRKHFIIHC